MGDAVGAGNALGQAAVAAAGPVTGQPLGAFGAVGDGGHPPLRGEPAFGVELHHGAVAESLDLLGTTKAHPLLAMGATRSRERPGLKATNTGSRVGAAGWPARPRAAAMARWRTASGLRAGIPMP